MKTSRIAGKVSRHCTRCAHILVATTVRPDTLKCCKCKEWKSDEEFYPYSKNFARRGRKSQCRSCDNAARSEYRRRNREAQRAYDREYRKRRVSS